MHPQLTRALEPVLRDLRAGGIRGGRIEPSDWPADDEVVWMCPRSGAAACRVGELA